ncbi:MAG: Ig-like domain-containing protein, partial [Gemmatimonadales bacterium]
TQHCVTATVRDNATNPVPGATVRFAVTGAHSTSGSAPTDANGQASFCYTGTQVGDDTITGFADTNVSGVQDPGEPSGTATKTWVVAT